MQSGHPGKLNKPAGDRTRTAELGPDHKAGEGAASLRTTDVYLDGEHIGSVTGTLKPNSTVRGCTYLTDLQQHPISHLAVA